MRSRVDFVARHYRGQLVDIGIGSGAFIELRRKLGKTTYGHDVNPVALEWLDKRGLLIDPYLFPQDAISCWDVLEHIADFRSLLASARAWVFLSIPLFRDAEHVLASKHFRPNEHFWYFTLKGLIYAFSLLGFDMVEHNTKEIEIGREDIHNFAFHRRSLVEGLASLRVNSGDGLSSAALRSDIPRHGGSRDAYASG